MKQLSRDRPMLPRTETKKLPKRLIGGGDHKEVITFGVVAVRYRSKLQENDPSYERRVYVPSYERRDSIQSTDVVEERTL